jgi:D-beta-D-heptose 7-phosphate kinase/D-beta-D-heptose 1-phosphate adenosyltransferase
MRRARQIARSFKRQRILVIGDLMLDKYIHGSSERLSPEAPVPVVRVGRERNVPGGAANVAGNACALGAQAGLMGVVGADPAGAQLMRLLRQAGISTRGVARIEGVRTTVKMRVLADRQQVVRVDWDTDGRLPEKACASFCRSVEKLVATCSGVVVEDYGKGIVRQDVMDAVLSAARRKGIPVGIDPKDNMDLDILGITLATPNYKEAHICAGLPVRPPPPGDPLHDVSLRKAADILLEKWRPELLMITLGPQGMYLASRGKAPRVIPTRAREVFDVSGAGDTVIATCVLALAAGASFDEAAVLGNNAAGVVVGKLGTATCSPEELLRSVEQNER